MITNHSNVSVIQPGEYECTVYEKCMSVSGTCICNMELPLTEAILSQTPQNEDEVTFHISCASGQKNCGSVFLYQLLFPCFHIQAEIES